MSWQCVVLKACEVCLAVSTGDVPQQARGQAQSGATSTAGNNNNKSLLPSDRQPSPTHTCACLFMQICSWISSRFGFFLLISVLYWKCLEHKWCSCVCAVENAPAHQELGLHPAHVRPRHGGAESQAGACHVSRYGAHQRCLFNSFPRSCRLPVVGHRCLCCLCR